MYVGTDTCDIVSVGFLAGRRWMMALQQHDGKSILLAL